MTTPTNATAATTTTYRTPEGQLIHNVIFSPDTGYYKWKDDQGRPCILKAHRFESMMTPVLVPDTAETPPPPSLVEFAKPVNGQLFVDCPVGSVSDGYHTFDELYEHRCLLFLSLMGVLAALGDKRRAPWFSKKHSDGSVWDGWFVAGQTTDAGGIAYHLPDRMLDLAKGAGLKELEQAPPYDGHNSEDVLARMEVMLTGSEFSGPMAASGRRFEPKLVLRQGTEPKSDLPPHQQRVIAEKAGLDEKIVKLNAFIETNPLFNELARAEREDLMDQHITMANYSRLLASRIARFKPAPLIVDEANIPTDLPAVTDFVAEAVTVNEDFALPSEEQVQGQGASAVADLNDEDIDLL